MLAKSSNKQSIDKIAGQIKALGKIQNPADRMASEKEGSGAN
jgi:hypothetical protein